MAAKKAKKKAAKKTPAYAFIDTNIFLDFYRTRNEASLSLLEKLETVRDRVLSTYQVEMEFLKNRQNEIRNIALQTKLSVNAALPAVLSDTPLDNAVKRTKKDLRSKEQKLKRKISQLLNNYRNADRVYNVVMDIFRSDSEHVLTRDMDVKNRIKRLARRRFQLGYPPRKAKDTSMGDAFNWEWVIHCASQLKGRIILVSRDSDYGYEYDGNYYLNDQLKREFRERVGRRSSLIYTHKLSDALRELDVPVTQKEAKSEEPILWLSTSTSRYLQDLVAEIQKGINITPPIQELLRNQMLAFNPMNDLFKTHSETLKALQQIRVRGLLDAPDEDDEDST